MGIPNDADSIRQQEAITELGQQAIADSNLDQLLSDASEAIAETLNNEYCAVLKLLPDGGKMRLRQGVGWPEESVGTATVPTNHNSKVADTLIAEEPIIVDDLQDESRTSTSTFLQSHDVVSGISVTIGDTDGPWGVLGTYTTERREFTDHDANFVKSIANVLASAIETERMQRRPKKEETLTEQIVETITTGITVIGADGEMRFANERAEEILGRNRNEIATMSYDDPALDIVDSAGNPVDEEQLPFKRVMKTGEAVSNIGLGVRRPDGERVWLSVNGVPLQSNRDEVTGAAFTFEDVTEQRHLESELSEVLDRVTDAMYALDREWRFTYVNDQAVALLSRAEGELSGNVIWDVFPKAVESDLYDQFHKAMESQEPVSFERYSEPLDIWAQVQAYPSETGLSVYFRDITERKEMEQELREREAKFRQLAEHLDQVVWMTTDDQREIVYVNPAFEEVWGRDREQLYENPQMLVDVVHPDDQQRVLEELDKVVHNKYELEYRIVRPDGEVRWIHDRATPIFDDDGNVYRIVGDANDVTERKEREWALEESEAKLRLLAENLEEIVWIADPDTKEILYVNPAYEVVWGRDKESLYEDPQSFIETVHPDDRERVRNAYAELPEKEFDEEYRIVRPDDDMRWIHANVVKVHNEDGKIVRTVGIAEDITEQKERERYLRDAKAQLEAATEAGAVGTWEWHIPEDEFVTGASLARLYGVDPEAARDGVSLDQFASAVHEADRERVMANVTEAVESCGEYEAEYRVWNADDEVRWVVARGHVECDDDGDPLTFPGALTDITERKRAEQALEEREKQLRTLLRLLPVGVMVAEADGHLVEANDAAKEIWGGFARAESVADYEQYKGWWPETGEQVAPEKWPLARALQGEEITDPEVFEIERFDGERRTILAHAMPVRDDIEEVTRAVTTMIDVTEREEREQQLQQQNERLESFASMLAHELRNPVTIGQIYSQQLPAETDSEAVEYVTEAFDRIEDMIDVMLVVARGREAVGERTPMALADVAWDAWGEVDAPNATLEVETDDVIQADETYIQHLFRNLFENAVQHGGGDVTIHVGELPDGFYVADDGTGIPPEDRDAVFEAGYTTAASSGGTGLGLSFIAELASVYEWECTVTESTTGGARVEFWNVEMVSESD